jgi:putative glutamine amidotransferase
MPRIAIAPCRAMADYLEAVKRPGGEPLELDYQRDQPADVVRRTDGLLLTGGGDVDPALYGEAPHATFQPSEPGRDEYEIALVRAATEARLPIFAICRGMQVLNVALGGTLHQHIGEEHRMRHHDVDIVAGSRLAFAVGGGSLTDSHCVHHQSVDRLGGGLSVTASTADGVIHAVEHDDASWVVGVQWHPEDTAGTDPRQQSLFDTLVHRVR